MDKNNKAKQELILRAYKRRIKTLRDFMILKNEISSEFKIDSLPNYGLTQIYEKLVKAKKIKPIGSARGEQLLKLLKKTKMRTLSGVAVVSVLTKPYPCPGECLYCPTEKGMPKSYLSNEPAVMRAILAKFDPYRQIEIRLEALKKAGHSTDKIELIVMGGSFSTLPIKYQYWFVQQCFKACNEFGARSQKCNSKLKSYKLQAKKLLEEQKKNEKAKHRIIGLTLETRPDLLNEKEILKFREMGATRVEIGVQSVFDEVLLKNKRGHGRKEIISATKLLKDAGFKVSYHMMPGLYGSDLKKDFEMFKEIFTNPDFQPDLIKIYPCVVTKNSQLYKLWKTKKYKPYTDKQLLDLIIKIKKIVPQYVRISRLVRDIPEESIVAGNKQTNLRQVIENHSRLNNWECRCIRCREIRDIVGNGRDRSLQINRIDYNASGGKEIFLQYVDSNNKLYAMLRLRFVGARLIAPLQGAAIIREVHTYGEAVDVGDEIKSAKQHKGLGKRLIAEAEKITRKEFKFYPVKSPTRRGACPAESLKGSAKRIQRGRQFHGVKKIAVIAGIGARDYYKKLGYKEKNTYMVKNI